MGSLAFFIVTILIAFFGSAEKIEPEYDNYQEFAVVEGRKLIFFLYLS